LELETLRNRRRGRPEKEASGEEGEAESESPQRRGAPRGIGGV